MPAPWTGEIVGKMHMYGITAIHLAEKLGINPKYLSAVLNGKREPAGAQQRFEGALDELLAERAEKAKL